MESYSLNSASSPWAPPSPSHTYLVPFSGQEPWEPRVGWCHLQMTTSLSLSFCLSCTHTHTHTHTHTYTHPFQYLLNLNQTLCTCLVLDVGEGGGWGVKFFTMVETLKQTGLHHMVPAKEPYANSLQQLKTEGSSMGPNRDWNP